MNITSHHIVFTKDTQRFLNENAMRNNNEHIRKALSKSMAANGWQLGPRGMDGHATGINWTYSELLDAGQNRYRYELHFTLDHMGANAPQKGEIRAIAKVMATHGKNPLGGRWTLATIDGIEYTVARDGEVMSAKDFTAYAEFDVPDNFEDAFDHLYGLESHIQGVKRSLSVARDSVFAKRYHVALIGPPGCGKSDICETLADMLGEDVVMKFDGTQTTAAGAIKQLDECEILPRIMVVEEIEKVAPEALTFLLALMDMRGEIRKTTARSKINKDTKILVIATVNNHVKFDELHANALSSRFSRKLWFHRPSEEVMRRILAREIADVDGDAAWIDPVIEYARSKDITDPRMLSALALCGGDGWLDGTFLKELADTDKPQDY